MEKRTCKLCFKTFSNGRALGGHMRSHMMKLQTSSPLPPPTPPTHLLEHQPQQHHAEQDSDETDSSSSSPSSSEEEDEDEGLNYKLRENPKKSFRLVDPEFSSFAVDAGSFVVQDRESETESSKNPSSRRRSKRSRKSGFADNSFLMMLNKYKPNNTHEEVVIEPEPVSSVSDTTPEEDVAWCLMMLSRGITEVEAEEEEEEEEEKAIEESEEEEVKVRVKRSRGKYQCGTCKKLFRSYQALGGHRASHKKMKSCNAITTPSSSSLNQEEGNVVPPNSTTTTTTTNAVRIHECPVCFRVFGSGQALGGHKRSHLTGGSASVSTTSFIQTPIRQQDNRFEEKLNFNMIDLDLNLPAPMEDDDDQIEELSAVSDPEFVHRNNNH